MVDNDISLYKILLEGFLKDAPFSSGHLFDLIHKNDFENADHYVHRIKGAAGQLGATPLHTSAQELENVLRGKKEGNVENLAAIFVDLYGKTYKAMEDEFNSL